MRFPNRNAVAAMVFRRAVSDRACHGDAYKLTHKSKGLGQRTLHSRNSSLFRHPLSIAGFLGRECWQAGNLLLNEIGNRTLDGYVWLGRTFLLWPNHASHNLLIKSGKY